MTIDDANTTIQINRTTRKDLTKIGKKGDTYDDIIKLLIGKWND